jgi:hypothetical protein
LPANEFEINLTFQRAQPRKKTLNDSVSKSNRPMLVRSLAIILSIYPNRFSIE